MASDINLEWISIITGVVLALFLVFCILRAAIILREEPLVIPTCNFETMEPRILTI